MENDRTDDDTYLKLDDGTKYPYSGANHIVYDLDSNTDEHPELGEDYDLYLDPNGYVLGFKLAGESETKYLYVQDSDEELRDWVARVDLADGTSPKVELKDTYKNTDGDSVDIAWDKDASEHVIKNATNIDERVWAYTVSESSNVYSLKEVNDKYLPAKVDDAFVADPDAEIKNGKAYVSQGDNEFIVDKQTIFVDTMNNVEMCIRDRGRARHSPEKFAPSRSTSNGPKTSGRWPAPPPCPGQWPKPPGWRPLSGSGPR